jgi:hypothetical protein
MEIEIKEIIGSDGITREHVYIQTEPGHFTTMLKSTWDEMQVNKDQEITNGLN